MKINTAKIKKCLLPNVPYLFIFIILLQVLPRLPFTLPLPDALAALIGAAAMRLMVYVRGKNAKKYRKNVEYGSARWGLPKDIAPYTDPKPENNVILTQTESLTMNSRPKPIKYARNKNILVIGGSGSGKTFFYVKPNLLQCESVDYPVSYVVTDPKGQILGDVGRFLMGKGYRIKVLNTIDFKKSMKYNPFVYIRKESDILKFVTALVENTKGDGKASDPFWEKAEKLLYQALIGYIWFESDEDDQNMNTLVDMINKMEVREDDDSFKNEIDFLFEELEERAPQHFALRQYKKFKLSAGKTAKSILVSCGARLSPFDIAEVRDLMSRDDMELDKIGGYKKRNPETGEFETVKQKIALFVIISDTDSSFNFIVALMYSQLFNILCDTADNDFDGRLPIHVRFLLDEFANIGLIPSFEKLIATIRSREISVSVILQALSQLKAIYKDNMDTIVGNCDTTLFLGGQEKTTLKDMSEMLGKETIDLYNTSITKGTQESHGQNFQKLGKDLMSVDEIAVMPGDKCILRVRGERPFFSKKFDPFSHKNFRHTADADKGKALDVAGLLDTKLKLKANDKFDVVEV